MQKSTMMVAAPAEADAAPSEFTRESITAGLGVWIGFLVGPNVMLASTNGLFMPHLGAALGQGRGAISAAMAVSVWLVGLLVPFSGWAMDRLGVKRLILVGVVLFGLYFLAVSQAMAFWQYIALQIGMGLASALHGSVGYSKVAALWFDRRRGVVLGLCVALGSGLGQIIMPKLALQLIETFGWRDAYMAMSAIVLLGGLPLIALLLRTPSQSRSSGVHRRALTGLTARQALGSPTFYLVFSAILLACFSLIGTLQHTVPMLLERGLNPGQATTVLSCMFVGVLLGEGSSGFLIDRINTPKVVLPYFLIALVGLLIVHSSPDFHLLILGGALMGLGLGCETGQNAYLTSRYFGLKAFGQIFGFAFLAVCLGIGLGLVVLGALHDHFGGYGPARYLFGATMALSTLCIALLPPFSYRPSTE